MYPRWCFGELCRVIKLGCQLPNERELILRDEIEKREITTIWQQNKTKRGECTCVIGEFEAAMSRDGGCRFDIVCNQTNMGRSSQTKEKTRGLIG